MTIGTKVYDRATRTIDIGALERLLEHPPKANTAQVPTTLPRFFPLHVCICAGLFGLHHPLVKWKLDRNAEVEKREHLATLEAKGLV